MKKMNEKQSECCGYYGATYTPVEPEKLVVISDGIYNQKIPIEGVRYLSPEHMSGWWLTTDKYDGNVASLKTVHFSHIQERRPDIAIYMALPFGYRFQLGGAEEYVWFDNEVDGKSRTVY